MFVKLIARSRVEGTWVSGRGEDDGGLSETFDVLGLKKIPPPSPARIFRDEWDRGTKRQRRHVRQNGIPLPTNTLSSLTLARTHKLSSNSPTRMHFSLSLIWFPSPVPSVAAPSLGSFPFSYTPSLTHIHTHALTLFHWDKRAHTHAHVFSYSNAIRFFLSLFRHYFLFLPNILPPDKIIRWVWLERGTSGFCFTFVQRFQSRNVLSSWQCDTKLILKFFTVFKNSSAKK